jgi:hypothetical protein
VINEELLEEEATSLLTDTQTTMLPTAMFNRRCKPEILQLLLHNRKHIARNRQGAGMVMRLFMYCKQENTGCLRVEHFLMPHKKKKSLDYKWMTYWS